MIMQTENYSLGELLHALEREHPGHDWRMYSSEIIR